VLAAAAAAALAACGAGPAEQTPAGEVSAYGQGYALAYRQADRMRNIDKLLIVKRESDELAEVTADVARVAALIADRLQAHAAADASVALETEFLPPIEAAARERMGLGIAGELLLSFGCDFEERLLFTEAVAVMRLLAIAEEMQAEAPSDVELELWAGLAAELEPVFERIRGLLNTCGERR